MTTAPSLEDVPASDTIYGQILKADGITPATDALLYLTLQDGDGTGDTGDARLLSALVDEHGYWHANLGNARTANGRDPFIYSQTGDILIMSVHHGTGDPLTHTQHVTDLRPAEPLILPQTPPSRLYLPLIAQ